MYKNFLTQLFFLIIPSIILFLKFKDKRKKMLISVFILFIIGLAWDYVALYYGLWVWNEKEIIGAIFGLPIDDYIFMFFAPLLGVGIYELVGNAIKKK